MSSEIEDCATKAFAFTAMGAAHAERKARILAGANAIAARLTREQREMDIDSVLYGPDGLPK